MEFDASSHLRNNLIGHHSEPVQSSFHSLNKVTDIKCIIIESSVPQYMYHYKGLNPIRAKCSVNLNVLQFTIFQCQTGCVSKNFITSFQPHFVSQCRDKGIYYETKEPNHLSNQQTEQTKQIDQTRLTQPQNHEPNQPINQNKHIKQIKS
jgi:hypothetical protein